MIHIVWIWVKGRSFYKSGYEFGTLQEANEFLARRLSDPHISGRIESEYQ